MIGLKRGVVKLIMHDDEWNYLAQQTIEKLHLMLGDVAVDIQHVGSTSIKDIAAKPIIDIAVAVKNFEHVRSLIPELEKNGFIFRRDVDEQNDILFSCGDFKEDTRTHHIHFVNDCSDEWKNYLKFRDSLNADLQKRKEYETLKFELAETFPNDRLAYTDSKSTFINKVLSDA